jgi:hypothetical protein
MAKTPKAEMVAAALTIPERLLLFCLASATDWQKVPGVTYSTAQRMLARGLIDGDRAATNFLLNDKGRAVLDALMGMGER